jgi:hypothetical protein
MIPQIRISIPNCSEWDGFFVAGCLANMIGKNREAKERR